MLNLYSSKRTPDEDVIFYDGILYLIKEPNKEGGYYSKSRRIIYKWNEIIEILLDAEYVEPISLKEIREIFPETKMIIFKEALQTWLYQFGNHIPDEWELVGEGLGYA